MFHQLGYDRVIVVRTVYLTGLPGDKIAGERALLAQILLVDVVTHGARDPVASQCPIDLLV